jgi:hypothetical protein
MRVALRSVLVSALLASASPVLAQVTVSITVAPPPLPEYSQPVCPGDGYVWTPGYWAWDREAGGYYWVPGTWIEPPAVGLLWTPGYWRWENTGFLFVDGYWGPVVGFYGGINYGFGYPGHGYRGGRWTGGHFAYNRTVNNVDVTVIHNTYVENVNVERTPIRASYIGANGGVVARPTATEAAAAKDKHVPATPAQTKHVQLARSMPQLHAAENKGKPPVAATARPDALQSRDTRAPGNESARNEPSNDRDKAPERSEAQTPARQTQPERRAADDGKPATDHGNSDGRDHNRSSQSARSEKRDEAHDAPQTARRTPSTQHPSRDEHAAKKRPDQKEDKGHEDD